MAVVRYRRAEEREADKVLEILNDVALWLRSREIEQWPEKFSPAHVADGIRDGYTWLVHVDGQAAGTLTLDWSDPLWHPSDEDAGYLHRLAVLRSASGLGDQVLAWAAGRVKARGRRFLRLDCVASNTGLRGYYERKGFQHRGDVDRGHIGSQCLGERSPSRHSLYELHLDPQG